MTHLLNFDSKWVIMWAYFGIMTSPPKSLQKTRHPMAPRQEPVSRGWGKIHGDCRSLSNFDRRRKKARVGEKPGSRSRKLVPIKVENWRIRILRFELRIYIENLFSSSFLVIEVEISSEFYWSILVILTFLVSYFCDDLFDVSAVTIFKKSYQNVENCGSSFGVHDPDDCGRDQCVDAEEAILSYCR